MNIRNTILLLQDTYVQKKWNGFLQNTKLVKQHLKQEKIRSKF